MDFFAEFRHPTRWYSKIIAAILAISFFAVLSAGLIAGFVVYRVVRPSGTDESVDLSNLPGHPEDVPWAVAGRGTRDGWFFPGLKHAPTILLCPGYRSSRGELLPLATALQEQQYNVFLFDFAGQRSKPGFTTLGFREVQELRTAMDVIAQRGDVDPSRFGLWGTNLGGYAALALAESDPRVRALAVQSVYSRPQDMAQLLVKSYGLVPIPFLRQLAVREFLWLNYQYRDRPPLIARIGTLAEVPKLFLEAADNPDLIASTHALFLAAPDPKREVMLSQGDYANMLDDDKRNYEDRIISFFLRNLPPEVRAGSASHLPSLKRPPFPESGNRGNPPARNHSVAGSLEETILECGLRRRRAESVAQSLIANRPQFQDQVRLPFHSLVLGYQFILESKWLIFRDTGIISSQMLQQSSLDVL
jgi:uncharacterized protein